VHFVQFGAWVRELRPTAQSVQFTANAAEKVPASHAAHVEAPSEVWVCIPAGQVMQSSLTAVGPYFPAVHSSHELMLNT
jgi:hypothetical protein